MNLKTDNRGNLFEWIKSPGFGQIFVSSTKPGITRGNHFHHTKTEKFLVIRGDAIIRFRKINEEQVFDYPVSGDHPQRSEEHTSELQSLMRISYAVVCLKKKK